MTRAHQIVTCLWFDSEGEEAAKYYTGIFKDSKLGRVTRYTEVGQETHKRPPGSVMTVEFQLNGHNFLVLNGGPVFKFNEAISQMIICQDQQEVDYYWERLTAGGDPQAQVCGWLKDKFGLSWQVVPAEVLEMTGDQSDAGKRAFAAMMKMKKIDLAAVKQAYGKQKEFSKA